MAVLASLPIAYFVAIRPIFLFRQAQFVRVFPLKLARFCMLSTGSGITNKPAIYLFFSSSFLPLCALLPLLPQTLADPGRNCLLSLSLLGSYNGSPDTHFFPGSNMVDDVAKGGALLLPCASLLILLVSTVYHFSDWSVLSYLNSLTHRLP